MRQTHAAGAYCARVLSVAFAAVLALALAPSAPALAEGWLGIQSSDTVTRAEWLSSLVETFDITVEDEEEYPEDYFSDLSSDNAHYLDVLKAVDFGIVDVAAGEEVHPDDPATREFAAQTLNYCLGFQLDEGAEYTFADASDTEYAADLQVAVNRSWFALEGDKVKPAQDITTAERDAMLADAREVWHSVDEFASGTDKVVLADGVKVVPMGTDLELTGDGNSIAITSCPITLSKGDRFAVYLSEVPVVLRASSISENGAITTVAFESVDADEAYKVLNYTEETELDMADFQAESGVETQSYPNVDIASEEGADTGGLSVQSLETQGVSYKNGTLSYAASIGVGSVKGAIAGMKVKHSADMLHNRYYVALIGTASLTASISKDIDKSVPLGVVSCGVCEASVNVVAKASGSVTKTVSATFEVGVQYDPSYGYRMVKTFKKGEPGITATATGRVGIDVNAGIIVPLITCTAGVDFGFDINYKVKSYADAPKICKNFDCYLYAGAYAKVKIGVKDLSKEWSKRLDVWKSTNSPVRLHKHIEDGIEVPDCTRGTQYNLGSWNTGGAGSKYGDLVDGDNATSTGWGYNSEGAWVQYPTFEYYVNSDGDATLTKYRGSARALIIPDNLDGHRVAAIGSCAFQRNQFLSTVSFPDSITEIGGYSFADCPRLSLVDLPPNLVTLRPNAFANDESLESVTIPASLTTCGTQGRREDGPFVGCENLHSVSFASGCKAVPANLMHGCSGLQSVAIPEGVTTIGWWAFAECSALRSVKLPTSLLEIEYNAFASCPQLASASLPSKLEKLGSRAFYDDDALLSVRIPSTLKESDGPYEKCSGLRSVTLPSGNDTVLAHLLSGCDGLETITVPIGYTEIGNGAFDGCANLKSVSLPSTLTFIGAAAFRKCTSLESVSIPDSVTRIDGQAFQNCAKLKSAALPRSLEWLGSGAFACDKALTSVRVPASLTTVGESYDYGAGAYYGPFAECAGIRDVTFESGCKTVNSSLLASCDGVESISIPEGISSIGGRAFTNCASLKKVTLPSTITQIGTEAFSLCTSLSDINLPDGVKDMRWEVFKGCSNLKTLALPSGLSVLPSYTFAGCTSLQSVEIPASITEIESNAFEGCAALESIAIPEGVTVIGYGAFKNCDSLTSVTIPNAVTSMGSSVFYDCDVLTDVTLSTGLTKIPSSTFQHSKALERIVIPYRVARIDANAFTECTKLKDVYIPASVAEIDTNAFAYSASMSIYGVAGSAAESYANERGIRFVAQNVPAASINVDKTLVVLKKGESVTVQSEIQPMNFTDDVVWKSSDPSIAIVDQDGKITAKSVGDTVIKLVVGERYVSIKVTVTQPVTSVSLSKGSASLEGGKTLQLSAAVMPSDAYNKDVQWSSSDETVAVVDQSGLVTALKKGTATIMATAKDGTDRSGSCLVAVTSNFTIATKVDQMESDHPYSKNSNDLWQYTLEGAHGLDVTFDERTMTEQGADYIRVYSGDMSLLASYSGEELAGKTVQVEGDTVFIRLVSDSALNDWGFKVMSVVATAEDEAPLDLADAVIAEVPVATYTGTAIEPKLSVELNGQTLEPGVDYEVAYSNNEAAGIAAYTITGIGNYVGAQSGTFTIARASIEGAELTIDNCVYTGKAQRPDVMVMLNGMALAEGEDYAVVYSDNIATGIASVTVKGIGNYTNSVIGTFEITEPGQGEGGSSSSAGESGGSNEENPKDGSSDKSHSTTSGSSSSSGDADAPAAKIDISKASVKVANKTYTGKALKPVPTVELNGKVLAMGADFAVAYKNNTKAGTATIAITGKGGYTGTKSATFKIAKAANPMKASAKAKSVKLANVKKKAQVISGAISAKKAQGKVTYAKVAKGSAKQLSVNKGNGKITVKKGTKKGTYKLKVKVTAKGNANYKAASKTITVTVKVK